jgi:hypothetical protein
LFSSLRFQNHDIIMPRMEGDFFITRPVDQVRIHLHDLLATRRRIDPILDALA